MGVTYINIFCSLCYVSSKIVRLFLISLYSVLLAQCALIANPAKTSKENRDGKTSAAFLCKHSTVYVTVNTRGLLPLNALLFKLSALTRTRATIALQPNVSMRIRAISSLQPIKKMRSQENPAFHCTRAFPAAKVRLQPTIAQSGLRIKVVNRTDI